jgi:hypothetical protein
VSAARVGRQAAGWVTSCRKSRIKQHIFGLPVFSLSLSLINENELPTKQKKLDAKNALKKKEKG